MQPRDRGPISEASRRVRNASHQRKVTGQIVALNRDYEDMGLVEVAIQEPGTGDEFPFRTVARIPVDEAKGLSVGDQATITTTVVIEQ